MCRGEAVFQVGNFYLILYKSSPKKINICFNQEISNSRVKYKHFN